MTDVLEPTYTRKSVHKLTEDEIKMLCEYTMPTGSMRSSLKYFINHVRHRKGYVIWLMNENDFLGWCFFRNLNDKKLAGVLVPVWRIDIYICSKYRRMGLASQLIKMARKKTKDDLLMVQRWDNRSTAFARSFSHYE